jgi:ribosomal protein S18 acetylase RimI-like enzyme
MAGQTQRGRSEITFLNLIGFFSLAFGECMRPMRPHLTAGPIAMPKITRLNEDQWAALRDMRLCALRESPQMFLSKADDQKDWERPDWEEEFKRGVWYFGTVENHDMGLIGVTREPNAPPHECYIEYMWISPGFRRQGMGKHMLSELLDSLRDSGMRTVRLWVLDGNHTASRLYERLGFKSTNEVVPIAARPGRTEERMLLNL